MTPATHAHVAAQVLGPVGVGRSIVFAFIPLAVVFGYHQWLRDHFNKLRHIFDLIAVLLTITAGVIAASSFVGQWAHALFGWIADTWNRMRPQDGGGDEWATVAAILLSCAMIGWILKIYHKQHRGPLTSALIMAAVLPVLLVATQGKFGLHAMQVVTALARPATFSGW